MSPLQHPPALHPLRRVLPVPLLHRRPLRHDETDHASLPPTISQTACCEVARETVDKPAAPPAPGELCAESLKLPAPLSADHAIGLTRSSRMAGRSALVARGLPPAARAAPTTTRYAVTSELKRTNNPERACQKRPFCAARPRQTSHQLAARNRRSAARSHHFPRHAP